MTKKSNNTTRPEIMNVADLVAIQDSPFQPEGRGQTDAYGMALDLSKRGQDHAILLGVVKGQTYKVQGHRRIGGAALGVELGILPADFSLRVKYKDYDSIEAMSPDVGDHGQTIGLRDKWELFQILAPILRSGSLTYAEIALTHAESFRQVWNVVDDKEAAIRDKVETAQILLKAGKKDAADLCLKEAQTIAGSYRNGVIQTYKAVATLPVFVAEYMKRVWLGRLEEGEPVLSHGDFMAISKAMKAGNIEASNSEAIEEIFEAVKAEKVRKAEEKEAKKANKDDDTSMMMKQKVVDAMYRSAGNKLFARILWCILHNSQSELKALDADMTTEGVEIQYTETKKVSAKK